MAHHPLTQFVESILALKRYRFRQEDLINLLRTGLYTDLSQADIDAFEQYIRYLGINGLPAFQQTFTKSHHGKFDLGAFKCSSSTYFIPSLKPYLPAETEG